MNIDHIVNKILNEITNTYSRGGYDYPLQNKILKFKKTNLDPFNVEVNLGDNPEDEIKKNNVNEDLAVWFGKKKKPKGSKQPKGPWVDICRKVNGKHPPCGRKDADKGSYPKCRAAGVAGKMSTEEKKRACRQKRAVERKDTQTGKGQKPNWVSHKKTNENMKTRIINLNENDLMRIVKRVINESNDPITIPPGQTINLSCKNLEHNVVNIEGKIQPGRTMNANRGRNEWILDPTGMTNRKVEVYIQPKEFIHKFTVESTNGIPEEMATPYDKEKLSVYIEPYTDDMAKAIGDTSGPTTGSKVLTHFPEDIPFEKNTGRYYCKYIEGSEGISNILESEGVKIA